MSDFSRNLKRIRALSGVTLQEISTNSGVSEATLSLIENRKRNPSLDTAVKISIALNISLSELAGIKSITNESLLIEINRLSSVITKIKYMINIDE